MAVVVHPVHHLQHHVGHGRIHAHMVGIVLGVQNVFAVNGHTGSRLVVPVDQLGDLVIIEGTAGKAAAGGLKGGLQVDARLGGKGIALGHGHQIGAGHHVVHQFGDAAAGGTAHIHGGTHALQQGLHFLKGLPVAAGHNGQGTGDGHGVAAADGRIQQVHAGVLGQLVQLENNVGRGGAQVHDHAAGLAVSDGLFHAVPDDGVGGQDLHDDVAGLVDLLRLGNGAARGDEALPLLFHHVVAQDLTAGLFQQILRHGQAHNTHTQKTNLFHRSTTPFYFNVYKWSYHLYT